MPIITIEGEKDTAALLRLLVNDYIILRVGYHTPHTTAENTHKKRKKTSKKTKERKTAISFVIYYW